MLNKKERAVLRNYEDEDNPDDDDESDADDGENYELLKSILSDAIALGAIKSCIFDRSST